MGLTGFVAAPARGSVAGAVLTGRDTNYAYTVGFSNSTVQYSTGVADNDGSFTMKGMIPGTYTLTVYKNELAVHTVSVAVAAGGTTTLPAIAITADPSQTVPLWRIGNWDGTRTEFLNGDKITTMHPSDVRMSAWNPGTYVVGSSTPATGMPCYQWKDVNANQVVQFNLTAAQIAASTVRVGITTAYAGGRPNIKVNSTTAALQSASTQPSSRTLTIGSYRGNNTTYSFDIPASALAAGTNTLTVYPISGSSGTAYLSPGYSLDCIDMVQGTQTLVAPMAPASLISAGGNAEVTLGWTASSGATSYNVLRGTTSGGPYDVIAAGLAATSYIDTGVFNGKTYYYVVTASNSSGTGVFSTQTSAIPNTILAPVISSALSAATQVGQDFSYRITATDSPVSFDASGLPDGLSVATDSGVISGAASQVGSYHVVLAATNAGGTGMAALSLVVSAVPIAAPVVTSATKASARVGSPFTYQITATNNPITYSASSLPDGLHLDTVTGLISGTPTAAGNFPLKLTVANAGGSGSAALSLTIAGVPLVSFVIPHGDGGKKVTVVGGRPKLKILVTRTGEELAGTLTVHYKTKGNAVPGVDYKLLSGVVIIPAGSASAKIKVRTQDDGVTDGAKILKLKLSADGSYNFGAPSRVKIDILDVESAP